MASRPSGNYPRVIRELLSALLCNTHCDQRQHSCSVPASFHLNCLPISRSTPAWGHPLVLSVWGVWSTLRSLCCAMLADTLFSLCPSSVCKPQKRLYCGKNVSFVKRSLCGTSIHNYVHTSGVTPVHLLSPDAGGLHSVNMLMCNMLVLSDWLISIWC